MTNTVKPERSKIWLQAFAMVMLSVAVHRALCVDVYYTQNFVWIYNPTGGLYARFAEYLDIYRGALMTGLAADAVLAALFASVAVLLPRGVFLALYVLFCAFLAANVEHIRYNFGHIDLGTLHHAASPTFIAGNAMTETLRIAFLAIAAPMMLYITLLRRVAAALGGVLAVAAVVAVALFLRPASPAYPNWMQTNPALPFDFNLADRTSDTDILGAALAPAPAPDQPISGDYNVLILFLEGMSQHSIATGALPNLSALAERNISFTNVFGEQLMTNNGLYLALSGDSPYFQSSATPWDALDENDPRAPLFLANRFRAAGYRTAFLQSADLEFMNKKTRLHTLGFQDILGDGHWENRRSRNGWGIDDLSLFEQVAEYLDALPDDGTPWMAAVLTTGTHAPFNVPDGVFPDVTPPRKRALMAADQAVGKLIADLEARGILEDTVVILTADESRESGLENPVANEVLISWLPLIVLHPSGAQGTVETLMSTKQFGRVVQAATTPAPLAALALSAPSDAPLIFGNHYTNRLFVHDAGAEVLYACRANSMACAVYSDVPNPIDLNKTKPDAITRFPCAAERLALREGTLSGAPRCEESTR